MARFLRSRSAMRARSHRLPSCGLLGVRARIRSALLRHPAMTYLALPAADSAPPFGAGAAARAGNSS